MPYLRVRTTSHGALPLRRIGSRGRADAARDPVASRSDFERHRLAALGGCSTRKLLVGSEQNVECIDDVCPSFLPRLALADCTGNLGYLRGQPTIASILVANRQMEGIAHGLKRSRRAGGGSKIDAFKSRRPDL